MATYYVDPDTGNDTTGDGSTGNPYATLQKAIDICPSGSAGNPNYIRLAKKVHSAYTGSLSGFVASGDLQNKSYITITAWEGQGSEERPILRLPDVDYSNATNTFGLRIIGTSTHHIIIDGIEADGINCYNDPSAPGSGSGFAVYNGAYDCDIINCVSHHWPTCGYHSTGDGWGGYGTDGILFENCIAYKNAQKANFGGSGFSIVGAGRNGGGSASTRHWMIFRNCYAYDQETTNDRDGSGFIFDYCGAYHNAQEFEYDGLCLMEGCVAFNNAGPGLNFTNGNMGHFIMRYCTSVSNRVATQAQVNDLTDYFGYSDAATMQIYGNVFVSPPNPPSSYRGSGSTWYWGYFGDYTDDQIEHGVLAESIHDNVFYAQPGQTYTNYTDGGATWPATNTLSSNPQLTNLSPDATERLNRAWAVLGGSSPVTSFQAPANPNTAAEAFETAQSLQAIVPTPADDYLGTARLTPPSWGAIEEGGGSSYIEVAALQVEAGYTSLDNRYFQLGAGYSKYVYSQTPHVNFSSDTQRFYAARVRLPTFPAGTHQDMVYHQVTPGEDCMLIGLNPDGIFYSKYWDGTANVWPWSGNQPPSATSGQWVWLGITREQDGADVVTRFYDGGNGVTPIWTTPLATDNDAGVTWDVSGDDYFYLGGTSDFDLSHLIAGSGLDLDGTRELDLAVHRDYVVGSEQVTPLVGPDFVLQGDAIFASDDTHLPAGIGTNGWTGTYTAIDEGLSSPNDADTMVGPDAGNGVTYVTMDDVEVDFVAMAEVKVTFRARVLESLGTSRFYVSAVGSNELTPLSGEVQVTGLTSSFQNVTVTLPSIVAGDSSAWNGFKLKFRQSYTETYVPPSGAEWDTYPSYPVYNGVGTKTVQDYLVMDANGVFGFNDTPESGNGTLFTDGGTDPAGRTVDIVEVSSRAAMLSAIDAANGSNFTIIVLTDGEYGANIARHANGVSNNCFNDKLSSAANLNKPIWVLAENKQAATFDQGSSLSAANRYAKGIAIALGGAADKRITGIYQTYSQNIAVEAGQAAPSYGSTAGAYSNIVIDHNRFNDMGQEGVVLRSTNGADAPNAIVAANIIEDTGNSSVLYGEGVYVGFDMPDCGNSEVVGLVIAYNEIRDWSSEGIEIKPNSKDVVIHDNYIHTNTGNVGGTDHGAFGIAIWRSAYNASPYGSAQSAVKYLDETGTAVAADGAGIRVFNNRIHSLANEDYTTGIHVGIEAELFNNRIWDIARDKGWGSGITVEKDNNAGLFDGHGFYNASYRTVTLYHNTGYNCQTGLLDTTGAHVGDVTIVASGNMADALGDMTAVNNDGGAVSGDFVGPITGTADSGDGPGSGFVLAGANEGGAGINNLITHDALRAARPNDDTNDYGALELVTAAPSGAAFWEDYPDYPSVPAEGGSVVYAANYTEFSAALGSSKTIVCEDGTFDPGTDTTVNLTGYSDLTIIAATKHGAVFDDVRFVGTNIDNVHLIGLKLTNAPAQYAVVFGTEAAAEGAGPITNCSVQHCRIEDSDGGGIVLNGAERVDNGEYSHSVQVVACEIVDCGRNNPLGFSACESIYLGSGSAGNSGIEGIFIAWNAIWQTNSAESVGEAIDCKGHIKDLRIYANVIWNNNADTGAAVDIYYNNTNDTAYGTLSTLPNVAAGSGLVIEGNRIYNIPKRTTNNDGMGLRIGHEAIIRNNLFWNIAHSAIFITHNTGNGLYFGNPSEREVWVYNNTCYSSGQDGGGYGALGFINSNSAVTLHVAGNVWGDDPDGGGSFGGSDYQVTAPATDFDGTYSGLAGGSSSSDYQYIGVGFLPASGGGLIDGGAGLDNLVELDALGTTRPDGGANDYGALEFVTAAPSGYTIGLTNPNILSSSGQLQPSSGQTIENLEFVDTKGDAATVEWHINVPAGVHDVTIRNCRFVGGGTGTQYYDGGAIRINNGCYNILVENCEFIDVYRMGRVYQATGNIIFQMNYMYSDYATQVVQYAETTGSGLRIAYNHSSVGMQRWSTNQHRDMSMQDNINCYGTTGTSGDPLLIVGNLVEARNNLVANPVAGGPANGWPVGWSGDFSVIGAGIIVGDNAGGYCTVKNNYVASAGTHKIIVSGGDHQRMENNTSFGDGTVDDWAWAGYGLYWQGWGGVDCPTNGYESGDVTKHTSYWGVRQDWGVMGGCEPGPTNTPPFYSADETLTHAEVVSRWNANINSIIDANGVFTLP